MHSQFRCILPVLVGWSFLVAASPSPQAPANAQDADRGVSAALNNLAEALKQPEKPSPVNEPCKAGEKKRTSDLCAQWHAVDAARSAARAAWWQGVVGSLIGALTLAAAWAAAIYAKQAAGHTKAGADEAKRAADAAERSLRHSEDVTRAELRAYFAAEAEKFRLERDTFEAFLDLHFRNVGQTPAQEVTALTQGRFIVQGKRVKQVIEFPEFNREMGTVGPKVPLESYNFFPFSWARATALESGLAQIELVFTILYRDMFGERWQYQQTIFANRRSVITGIAYTSKCETSRLPLTKRKQSSAKRARSKTARKSEKT